MSDNLFDPGPRPSEGLANPTPHDTRGGGGYLSNWCSRCQTEEYPTNAVSTRYCEDAQWAKAKWAFDQDQKRLIATRRHEATEEAIKHARSILSEKQWELLQIKVAPYRDVDRIIV